VGSTPFAPSRESLRAAPATEVPRRPSSALTSSRGQGFITQSTGRIGMGSRSLLTGKTESPRTAGKRPGRGLTQKERAT